MINTTILVLDLLVGKCIKKCGERGGPVDAIETIKLQLCCLRFGWHGSTKISPLLQSRDWIPACTFVRFSKKNFRQRETFREW